MIESRLDEIIKKIINDPDIFQKPGSVPLLFDKNEWLKLKDDFRNGEKAAFEKKIDDRINELRKEMKNGKLSRKNFDKLRKLAQSLKKAYTEKTALLKEIFELLDSYGIVICNLPSMDQYGAVVERYPKEIVLAFFMDKIKKEKDNRKKNALRKIYSYLMELYAAGLKPEEIGYITRKLNSLTNYWEVI